ncbi:hypothetical protein DL768_006567 [Monosporascus sp. mg162]|nr:hypothetical protein DL768_006567 [Monosporascus sp. mg162]
MTEQGYGGPNMPQLPEYGDPEHTGDVLTDHQQCPQPPSPNNDQVSAAAIPSASQEHEVLRPSPPISLYNRQSNEFSSPYHRRESPVLSGEGVPFVGCSTNPTAASGSDTQLEAGASNGPETTTLPQPLAFQPIWKIWWPEALSLLLGFFSFFSIVIVLGKFNQQGLPNWPYNITLNTFLAVMSTIARAAFMFPVSVAISQAQWTWFFKDRPLYDFHLIDQASRSLWGSLVLLWRIRVFRHPVALGATLTLLGVLTSPITQLAITYPVRDVPDLSAEASTPAIRSLRQGDNIQDGTPKALLLGSLPDVSNFTLPAEPVAGASCATGNCTFGSYHSLGVCVRTANITSHLVINESEENAQQGGTTPPGNSSGVFLISNATGYTASLPGGFDLSHQGPLALLVDILSGNNSFGFSVDSEENEGPLRARIASLVNLYTVPLTVNETWSGAPDSPGKLERTINSISSFRHEAVEVLFYLCVQTYETSVASGVEKSRVLDQLAARPGDPAAAPKGPFLDVNCTAVFNNTTVTCFPNPSRWDDILQLETPESDGVLDEGVGNGEAEGFSTDYRSMERIAWGMQVSLTGYAMSVYDPELSPPMGSFASSSSMLNLFQDVLYRLDSSEQTMNNTDRQLRLTNLYLNIATSLSSMQVFTVFPSIQAPSSGAKNVFNVTGQAWHESPYVHVTWGWLSFLGAELVLATLLLAITAFAKHYGRETKAPLESRSVPPDLKDSSLAILSALSPECRVLMGEGIQPLHELEARSRRLRVRLEGCEIIPVDYIEEGPSSSRRSFLFSRVEWRSGSSPFASWKAAGGTRSGQTTTQEDKGGEGRNIEGEARSQMGSSGNTEERQAGKRLGGTDPRTLFATRH